VSFQSARVRAPEFPRDAVWLNTGRPLSLRELRGQVVLLDFFTYGCINCQHVQPDLAALEHKYGDALAVIGVHSAKFAAERDPENVRQALLRHGITHPVVLDPDLRIWDSYAVRAWPTLALIDRSGYSVGAVSGEGKRDLLDTAIAHLLGDDPGVPQSPPPLAAAGADLQPLQPLSFPGKVLVAAGRLVVADSAHHRLVIADLHGSGATTVGSGARGDRDGDFEQAEFASPRGLALSADGQLLYVADTGNHRLRAVDLQARRVTTIAGTGLQHRGMGAVSGPARATALNSPWDLVRVGTALYIAMAGAHQIWLYDLLSDEVMSFAGIGAEACIGGPRTESAFAQPSGITGDGHRLWTVDAESSTVRWIDLATDTVGTVCGSEDLFDFGDRDGIGTEVRLQHPLGIAFDGRHLWVADSYNHRLKRVDPQTGACTTIVGTGQMGASDGERRTATFHEPGGIACGNGLIYVADTNNHRIRVFDPAVGTVATLDLPGLCAPGVCFPLDRRK